MKTHEYGGFSYSLANQWKCWKFAKVCVGVFTCTRVFSFPRNLGVPSRLRQLLYAVEDVHYNGFIEPPQTIGNVTISGNVETDLLLQRLQL